MINPSAGNTIFSHEVYPVWGQSFLEESLYGYTIRITSDTFFQANPRLALEMFKQIEFKDTRFFIEMFAGIGIIGLLHSTNFEKGIGFESNPSAVKWGNSIFEHNHISAYRLHQADLYQTPAEELIRILSEESVTPEKTVLVADPPRRGLGEEILKFLNQFRPRRLIYISCNPKNFAREARRLLDAGYRLEFLEGYDLFPYTPHLEVVGHFTG
jgi:23S rRNA (uracil1939-C5)-methyltransferase